jgi:hypothetical protein
MHLQVAPICLSVAVVLGVLGSSAKAHEESMYPDWSGQWLKPEPTGQWDPSKPTGRGQHAPLTAEYQAIFEKSLASLANSGQGLSARTNCLPNGMPRVMSSPRPFEFVILPKITYINFHTSMPRRIYTDGRNWPANEDASFLGYSIGARIDTDGDEKFDALEVETRNFKGPRTFEQSGIPLHTDNETVVKERIALDKRDLDLLRAEITTFDHALTSSWTVNKTYRRIRDIRWHEEVCNEHNKEVIIAGETYYLSADGRLMPTRKNQPPPDLYFFDEK